MPRESTRFFNPDAPIDSRLDRAISAMRKRRERTREASSLAAEVDAVQEFVEETNISLSPAAEEVVREDTEETKPVYVDEIAVAMAGLEVGQPPEHARNMPPGNEPI